VPQVNSSGYDYAPSLSADGLTLIFQSDQPANVDHLWMATRPSVAQDFGPPQYLSVNASGTSYDRSPALSSDDLTLYFSSNRGGGFLQLYRATRPDPGSPFGTPQLVSELATVEITGPSLSTDGSELFFSNEAAPVNLYLAIASNGTFSPPTPIAELNTSTYQGYPSIRGDGRELYFESQPGSAIEIWAATRAGPGAPFTNRHRVDDLDQSGLFNVDPELSRDGATLVWASNRTGGVGNSDLYIATRACL
jgi:Tol biopolymer transport system component